MFAAALGAHGAATSQTVVKDDPAVLKLAGTWNELSKAPPGSRQAGEIRAAAEELARQLPAARRASAMAAMMNTKVEPDSALNLAAVAVFGPDPMDPNALASLLANDRRGAGENHVLVAYYALLNKDVARRLLSMNHQSGMLAALGERLVSLKDKEVPPAEQDLLIDLCREAVRSATKTDRPTEQVVELRKAFKSFWNTAVPGPLEATIKDWLRIINADEDLTWGEQQILLLGHWDEAKQSGAAMGLGRSTMPGGEVTTALEKLLDDPRNSIRAYAAVAFRYSSDPLSEPAADKLVRMYRSDRVTTARREAALALAAHANDSAAGKALPAMLETITDPNSPDPVLTYTWQCIKRFVPSAGAEQKRRICQAAIAQLPKRGLAVLEAIKALGPDGAPAADALRKYRSAAPYGEREIIDRILRELQPGTAPTRPSTRP
jgi:hypothetical protein